MRRRLDNLVKMTIRKLRRDQTDCEAVLWSVLKNRKISGLKFLRQHPIVFEWNAKKRFLIADFYCHEARLIIEVDGSIHENQKDYDEVREYVLKCLGMRIIRFDNKRIISSLENVLQEIKDNIHK